MNSFLIGAFMSSPNQELFGKLSIVLSNRPGSLGFPQTYDLKKIFPTRRLDFSLMPFILHDNTGHEQANDYHVLGHFAGIS